MKSAEQILGEKGYSDEIADIIHDLDIEVRDKFEISEPIFLWEKYYIGDADHEILCQLANAQGFEGIHDLFEAMDWELISMCQSVPSKWDKLKPVTAHKLARYIRDNVNLTANCSVTIWQNLNGELTFTRDSWDYRDDEYRAVLHFHTMDHVPETFTGLKRSVEYFLLKS